MRIPLLFLKQFISYIFRFLGKKNNYHILSWHWFFKNNITRKLIKENLCPIPMVSPKVAIHRIILTSWQGPWVKWQSGESLWAVALGLVGHQLGHLVDLGPSFGELIDFSKPYCSILNDTQLSQKKLQNNLAVSRALRIIHILSF